MKPYLECVEAVLEQAESRMDGLRGTEAEERAEQYGPNRLREAEKTPLIKRFLQQFTDPMTIILIIAAIISGITAAISQESIADVMIIMTVVIVNAVLGVVQESKAEEAIQALQKISGATCKVFRDGSMCVLPSADLVPGDVIALEAGDAVPADARLLECAQLQVEEAALTGESVPVRKQIEKLSSANGQDVPLGDRLNMVYMGSAVAYGRGRAVVVDTGMRTEMGKIAEALNQVQDEDTPLQKRLGRLSKTLSVLVLVICAAIFLLGIIRQRSDLTLNTMLGTFMTAVSLAVAAIPEGLAAVVTIVLSIGVTNMSHRNAIIRKMTAVETLGCTEVICTDKTGTLTQNRMTVVEHTGDDSKLLMRAMALASDAELNGDDVTGEPTEAALVAWARAGDVDKNALKKIAPRIGEAPFDSMRKLMSTVHKTDRGYVQYTKGAPDELLKKCAFVWENGHAEPLTDEKRNEILGDNRRMAMKALRVLGAAFKFYDADVADFAADALERELTFIGLTGMIDPVRPEVARAIDECREAGVRPVMITGDHRDTAAAIGLQLGIIESDQQAMTGQELDGISDDELTKVVEKNFVYARVQPEHKVRIVNAWKRKGKVTAMTGDGVNDAPSIKNADIGIGMGITGTDVTKNVADMVLQDDNFATIVSAIEEGRRIYDNICKAIQLLLSTNLSEVSSIFIATMLGFTLLSPAHLLWINLITDCFPALALGFEPAEADSMRRPPRSANAGIFADGLGLNIALQSVLVTAITLIAYLVGCHAETGLWGFGESATGTTMAFLTLALTETFHSFNMRSLRSSIFTIKRQNVFLWLAMALSLALTLSVVFVPALNVAFGFAPISGKLFLISCLMGFSIIPLVEIIKSIEGLVDTKKRNTL